MGPSFESLTAHQSRQGVPGYREPLLISTTGPYVIADNPRRIPPCGIPADRQGPGIGSSAGGAAGGGCNTPEATCARSTAPWRPPLGRWGGEPRLVEVPDAQARLTPREAPATIPLASSASALRSVHSRSKEPLMRRVTARGLSLLLGLGLLAPAGLRAQTTDDTVIYALQSDLNTWDPPHSVFREAFILSYNVFDHLPPRDVETGKLAPILALSW